MSKPHGKAGSVHLVTVTFARVGPTHLNVHLLEGTYQLPHDCLRLDKEEYGGTVSVKIGRCKIFGKPAFILRPGENPSQSVLEIATDIKLREAYNLQDGDIVEVELVDPKKNSSSY